MIKGIIARDDITGLGIQSYELIKHLNFDKILTVKSNLETFTEYEGKKVKNVTDRDIKDLCKDIDLLFCVETPYNKNTYSIAKTLGVKTILQYNYEWLDYSFGYPDLFLSPTIWNYNNVPDKKKYIPFPVNRDNLPFKLRRKANVFLHNAGDLKAGYDRNGTEILLKAIPLVKSDVKFVINSQKKLKINDSRVKVNVNTVKNYYELFNEGDVFLFPRRYGGLCLPLLEALSCGMPIIMPDISPQNRFLPKKLLVETSKKSRLYINQEIDIFNIAPEVLAEKIDEVSKMDLNRYSKSSDSVATCWSWKTLKSKYEELLTTIIS